MMRHVIYWLLWHPGIVPELYQLKMMFKDNELIEIHLAGITNKEEVYASVMGILILEPYATFNSYTLYGEEALNLALDEIEKSVKRMVLVAEYEEVIEDEHYEDEDEH